MKRKTLIQNLFPATGESFRTDSAVWDHEAKTYDETRLGDPVYASCIHQVANEIFKRTGLCLDAGCGTGLSSSTLGSKCDVVVALDYSMESLKILRDKEIPNLLIVQADLRALPFTDSTFDACVCANTLQHLRPGGPQERAINELTRVTKEDGTLILSVHHYSRGKRKAGWIKEGKPGQDGIDYIFRFSRNDLMALLPGARVKGVGFYGFLGVPFFGSRLQNFLSGFFGRIAARLGFGHMLIAITRKGSPSIIKKPVD